LATFASPPCFMHELDPAYLGYLPPDETIALLNLLLEAEKAGARGVMRMARDTTNARLCVELTAIARDEAGFCAMLAKHIRRLGGEPSTATGAFYDKLVAREGDAERMALLDRGQTWVALKLREVLPRIGDEALHKDLAVMLDVHERNIRHCAGLGGHAP
jgi:Domain of unknown function (DUF6306)